MAAYRSGFFILLTSPPSPSKISHLRFPRLSINLAKNFDISEAIGAIYNSHLQLVLFRNFMRKVFSSRSSRTTDSHTHTHTHSHIRIIPPAAAQQRCQAGLLEAQNMNKYGLFLIVWVCLSGLNIWEFIQELAFFKSQFYLMIGLSLFISSKVWPFSVTSIWQPWVLAQWLTLALAWLSRSAPRRCWYIMWQNVTCRQLFFPPTKLFAPSKLADFTLWWKLICLNLICFEEQIGSYIWGILLSCWNWKCI